MLSQKQKEHLRDGWRNCPTGEKKIIMAEFIREYGDDPGWEAWLVFLQDRLEIPGYDESFAVS